jgi:hypothetical protein
LSTSIPLSPNIETTFLLSLAVATEVADVSAAAGKLEIVLVIFI